MVAEVVELMRWSVAVIVYSTTNQNFIYFFGIENFFHWLYKFTS